jgi:HAD superfamily hydrolase (TIGR01509 family)
MSLYAPLRAVIFDIGRVLVKVDVARSIEGLARGISMSPSELWAAIEKDPRWHDWQEGRLSPHDWYLHVTKRLGSPLKFDEFRDTWNRALDPEPLQAEDLFAALAKKHKLALLSNTDPIHVAHLESTYSFFKFFPSAVRIYSCAVRASKPSPVIFQAALKAVRTPASQAVFIDDILAYVKAARSLGLHAIQYLNPSQLRDDLRALDPSLTL